MTNDDPVLDTVTRRLLFIEGHIEQLRADVAATQRERRARQARDIEPPAPQAAAPKPAPTPASAPPRAPQQSHLALERLVSGRGLAVAGVLLMLVGCAFFLDLSFTRGWIAPAGRIALGLIAGTLTLAASTRFLRGTYRVVAEASSGLGAGVVYLSSWAALAIFPELDFPRVAAFAIMAAVAGVLTFVANRWRSQPIALMGLAGAYLTPLLLGNLTHDRTALAAYLVIVTGGLLVLARRRAFIAVEATAASAMLLFGVALRPDPDAGWTNDAAAAAYSCFFLLLNAAFTTRPIRVGTAPPLAVVPFIGVTALYIAALHGVLAANQTELGVVLLGVAAVLFAAPRLIPPFPRELRPVSGCLSLVAANLALRSLLGHTELFDAFSIQAAALTILGARWANANVARLGLGFFAAAGLGLLWDALTFAPAQQSVAPAQALCTPLLCGFAVWLSSAVAARRAIPAAAVRVFSLATHGVALAALTRAGLDATGGPGWNVALPNVTQVSLSLLWALDGAALFARGVATRHNMLRWEGLALFAVTIVKVFTVDLASLDLVDRVLAFVGTGGVLFVSSAWYMRSQRMTDADGDALSRA